MKRLSKSLAVGLLTVSMALASTAEACTNFLVTKGASKNFGIGIALFDRKGGISRKKSVLGTAYTVAPAPLSVRLVPHLKVCYPALVMLCNRCAVIRPALLHIVIVDWGTAHSACQALATLIIKNVAVAKAHPRSHSVSNYIITNIVKPAKIVDALLLLRLLPA